MGMFNDVDFRCKCPHCEATVEGFQTKDGDDLCLKLVQPGGGVWNFYATCTACGAWLDFVFVPPLEPGWVLRVTPQEDEQPSVMVGPYPLADFSKNCSAPTPPPTPEKER